MPKIDLNRDTLPDFERRISALTSTQSRQWGTMSLAQMLAHLRIVLEISLEERETTDESRAWLMPIIWLLMFEWITNWPKGKVKASTQFLDDTAEDVESERAQVLKLLGRFVERSGPNRTRADARTYFTHQMAARSRSPHRLSPAPVRRVILRKFKPLPGERSQNSTIPS